MGDDLLTKHLIALPYFRSILRTVEARIIRGVELPEPTLDVGCGDGHFASVTLSRPIAVGLDPDHSSLQEARSFSAYRELIAGAGAELPFARASFASAVSNSVLEHIPGLEAVLRDVARVLRQGAPFAITVPNPGYRDELQGPAILERMGLKRAAASYREWFMRMSRTWNLYDEAEWSRILEEAGFQIKQGFRYFPPASLHALEWGHYFGAPCLLPRKLVGRWILVPRAWNVWLTKKIIGKYAEGMQDEAGTYSFFLARRV